MSVTRLDPRRIETIFFACLFQDGEDTTDHLVGEGITTSVGFHPGRLEEYEQEITDLLADLPEPFMRSKGGGWSFLQACFDKNNIQWTGSHRTMEQLFQLGIATRKAEYMTPRDMWMVYPGGMPYIVVND